MKGKKGAAKEPYAGIRVVGRGGVPRYTQAPQEYVQRTAVTTAAAAINVSTGKHDGTICDARPNGIAVHGTTADAVRAGTDANDAAAADDGTATTDDGTNGAIVSHGTAATVGLTANATIMPESTALCWI